MSTEQKKLDLMYQLIADAGGIENIDLHSEYAKAITNLNKMSFQANQGIMANNSQIATPQPPQAPISTNGMQSTPQDQNGLNQPSIDQNAPQGQENTPPGM
jgi:hypothetical protein